MPIGPSSPGIPYTIGNILIIIIIIIIIILSVNI